VRYSARGGAQPNRQMRPQRLLPQYTAPSPRDRLPQICNIPQQSNKLETVQEPKTTTAKLKIREEGTRIPNRSWGGRRTTNSGSGHSGGLRLLEMSVVGLRRGGVEGTAPKVAAPRARLLQLPNYVSLPLQKMYSLYYILPLPLRFFP
jgi:hypothetical protein